MKKLKILVSILGLQSQKIIKTKISGLFKLGLELPYLQPGQQADYQKGYR